MKPMLTALLCLLTLHVFPDEPVADKPHNELEETFNALENETNEKLWNQATLKKPHTHEEYLAWHKARVEQWGMHLLERWTGLLERHRDDKEYGDQIRRNAHNLWVGLHELQKAEYQKYLDDWKAKWSGDEQIEAIFYESRRYTLAVEFSENGDVEKIARTLLAEFPSQKGPYHILLSLARRNGAEAYEAALQAFLKSPGTPESIKQHLRGKPEDMEWDYYEIRKDQISYNVNYDWDKKQGEKGVRLLMAEFPERKEPYDHLLWVSSMKGGGSLWACVKEITNSTVSEKIKAYVWEEFLKGSFREGSFEREYDEFMHQTWDMDWESLSQEEAVTWLQVSEHHWQTALTFHAEFMERFQRSSESEWTRWHAIRPLTTLWAGADSPEDRKHLEALCAKWLALPGWSEENRMELRNLLLFAQETDMREKVTLELRWKIQGTRSIWVFYSPEARVNVARALMREFPKQEEPYKDCLFAAWELDHWERELFQDLLNPHAPAETQALARNTLRMMERIGKPFEVNGTPLGDPEAYMQAMRGKVILIDFWTTTYSLCINERFRLTELYDKYHEQGLEIISVNWDDKLETIRSFRERNTVLRTPWPQHYWNKNAWDDYHLVNYPPLWLVDDMGLVRDVNASYGLEQKIEKWLSKP